MESGIYFRHNSIRHDRHTLVFVHGLSGSSSAWRPYEEALGGRYNLLFFDLRGHGKSVKKNRRGYYLLDNIADDICALAKRFGLGRFILIGHSFGALLALDFAGKHPGMAEALVLLAPDYRIGKTLRIKIARPFLAFSKILYFKPFKERAGEQIDYYSRFPNTGDWNVKRIYTDIKNTTLRVYCECLRQAQDFDAQNLIPDIKIPVLVIHGKKDTVFPLSDSEAMVKKMPRARLKILPEVNHILVMNNWREVESEIDNFVRSLYC